MLCANIELAERMDESADDITAAETAPKPKNEMKGGQRCWSTIGRIMSDSSFSVGDTGPYDVWFQSDKSPQLCRLKCVYVIKHFH